MYRRINYFRDQLPTLIVMHVNFGDCTMRCIFNEQPLSGTSHLQTAFQRKKKADWNRLL